MRHRNPCWPALSLAALLILAGGAAVTAAEPAAAPAAAAPAVAQPSADSAAASPAAVEIDGKQLLRDAHAKSEQAKTLQQYTEVIELCQRAAEGPLSENLSEYAKKLRSWAHNQRGEHYAEQAASLQQAGQHEPAARLDELALAEFETAIELNPDYWKAIHNRGVNRALASQFDTATEDFSRAIGLKPDYANAWFNRGEIYFELGRFDQAIADYSRALQLNERDFDTHIRRGHAYFRTSQYQQALADYNTAVQLAPENVEALVNRADAYRSLGRWQQAADDYLQAVRLDPKAGRAYQGAAWMMATCPEARMRNPELALRAARQALELLGPEDYLALDALAAAQANSGEFEAARKTAAAALQAAPEERRPALQKRLELYQQSQPYRDQ